MSEADFLQPGGRFGRLQLEREIGEGAFSRVWLARDARLKRQVALKVLHDQDVQRPAPEDRTRFLEEARIVAGFHHPHIATLYNLHETPGGGYALELEYLDGGSLQDALGEGERLPLAEALVVARAVASALAEAHAAGVIHGDIKPGNILRGKDGRIKLLDFGLARLFGQRDLEHSYESVRGTPLYLAPEVIAGEAFQPASDIWSFGVLLYRLLSGRLPFPRTNLFSLFLAIQNEAPVPLGTDVPPDLAGMIERCLAKRAGDRYRDGAEVLRALEERSEVRRARPRPAESAAGLQQVTGHGAAREHLQRALGRLDGGRGGVLVITGSAGIGKSTLVAAAAADVRARGWRALVSHVSVVEGIVRPLFRAARLAAAAPGAVEPEGGAEATMFGLERALASLTSERPLVVAVEDLHQASEEEVRLLGRACRRLEGRPVLWLVTERTSDLGLAGSEHLRADPLLADDGGERIDLQPLDDDAVYAILAAEAGGGRLAGPVADPVIRRSAGNPLFALQLFRHMRETGAIVEEEGVWSLREDGPSGDAPPALRGLVSRRLRELPEPLRALLDVAAVDGVEFDGEAVAAAVDEPRIAVLRRFQTLYRAHGLVVPRKRGYGFAHPLLQEVIYSEVAPDLRRELHRILAEHLASRADPADPERLGVHWERSDAPERARPHLIRAADAAAKRLENFRCVDLATRAGIVPGEVPVDLAREHAEGLLQIASALGEVGRREERELLHGDLLRAADELGDPVLRLRVHARRGLNRMLGMGLSETDEAEVRAAAEQLPSSVDRGIAYYTLGMMERLRGRLDRAEANLLQADRHFLAHGAQGRHGSVLDQLGSVAERSGRYREAARFYSEAARVCRETGRLANAAISGVNEIKVRFDLGEVDGLTERLADAARLLDVDGLLGAAARVRLVLANVHYALGDLQTARGIAEASREVVSGVGTLAGICEAHLCVSSFAAAAGDLDFARSVHEEGVAAVEQMQDPRARAELWALDAVLCARAGDTKGAEQKAGEAVELASAERDAVAVRLAEAALHGMPAGPLVEIRRMFPEPTEGEAATTRSARAFLDGMLAAGDRAAAAEELERCARILARRDAGRDRALLHLVADVLRSHAAARRGDPEGAEEALMRATGAASHMGYSWAPRER